MKRILFIIFIFIFPFSLFSQKFGRDSDANNFWVRNGTVLSTKTSGDDILIRGKLDVGSPGSASGADFGEGGSYTKDSDGVTIVYAYSYDASASSGSRFTSLILDASNTWLGDVGDRMYVGSTKRFWAARFNLTQAKSVEVLEANYWNGSALTSMDLMGILKDAATTTGQAVLEQTSEKEYVTWDKDIDSNWSVADNQLDDIPNVGFSLFWVCLQVPSGGLTTPPITDEIKARGTDFDFVTGASYPVFWGQARVEKHERISLSVPSQGAATTSIDIDANHQQTVFDFNSAGDNLSDFWTVPEGADTSSKIAIHLTYAANAIDTYTIDLSILKLKNVTAIGSGVSSDYTSTTNISAVAANTIYTEVSLTVTKISIQDLTPGDIISFELQRTDATNAIRPIAITIHYVIYSTGEHV